MHTVYFSLGSNLGDKEENLRKAIEEINKLVGDVTRQSTFYVTEPWGFQRWGEERSRWADNITTAS